MQSHNSAAARAVLCQATGVDETASTDEAAALMGRAKQTLLRWACEGSGPKGLTPRRVNGRLRWPLKDIRAVMAGTQA
jgi:hypothetical protein